VGDVIGPIRVPDPRGSGPPRLPSFPPPAPAPTCDHPRTEVRRFRQSNGVTVARVQCLTCGAGINNVRKDSVADFDSLPAFDDALRDAWRRKVEDHYRRLRDDHDRAVSDRDAEWWAWYDSYLASASWGALRRAALERDGWLCQGCRRRRATQVHHLTYRRVGDEMLFDLASVCDACHDRLHPRGHEGG